MKITAYAPLEDQRAFFNYQGFIVETFFSLVRQTADHTFVIITDIKPECPLPSNTQVILKTRPKTALFKKLWWNIKVPATLKKLKADLFISFDNVSSLSVSIPQIIIVEVTERVKPAYLKKARLLIVNSKSVKNQLISKYNIAGKKIAVIYPSAGENYKARNTEEKELIKKELSDSKEYFLYNGTLLKNENFIDLLKSFSHFKKRQQSSFKLLLLSESNPFFEKSLSGYKYRADVKLISSKNKNDPAMITAAAYAVVLPFSLNEDLIPLLNAMQAGVPVIVAKSPVINEVAAGAAIYAETSTSRDIGEKMIQVYTDENYRSSLIQKGITVADKFRQEKAVKLLGQAIMNALE